MKKFTVIFLSILASVFIFSSQASAIDVYAFGSYWEKSDSDDGDWGAGIGLSLPILTEMLRIDGRVYLFEDSEARQNDKVSITPFDLGLQVHFLPAGKVDPYLLGGVSYLYVDSDSFDYDIDSNFGGYLGGGLEFEIFALIKLFGELTYRFSELDSDSGEDFDPSGFNGNIGLKLHF